MIRGLILKDFINIRKQVLVFLLIIIAYMFIAIVSDKMTTFHVFVVLLFALLPITDIDCDEKVKWDKYCLTMPVSRKKVVTSKYLFGMIMMAIAFVIGILFDLAISIATHQEYKIDSLIELIILTDIGLLFVAFSLPIIFKFGTERGRYIMILLTLLFSLLPRALANLSQNSLNLEEFFICTNFMMIFNVVVFVVSYFLSVFIYERKQFI